MSTDELEPMTPEEEDVKAAAAAYFEAITTCAQAGGNPTKAIMAAMPAEAREQMGMMGALGLGM